MQNAAGKSWLGRLRCKTRLMLKPPERRWLTSSKEMIVTRLTLLAALILSIASCGDTKVIYQTSPPPIPDSLIDPKPVQISTDPDPARRAAEGVTNLVINRDELARDRAAVRCIVLRERAIAAGEKGSKDQGCVGPQ
jgi:hypothetical protein